MIAEIKKGGGEVKIGWVKAHMGILGNEATDVLAKQAAEGVPPDDHDKWMSGGGIRQWAKRRNKRNVEEGGGIRSDGMEAEGSNQLLSAARRKGRGEEEQTPDHIVFRSGKVRRVRDERGREG